MGGFAKSQKGAKKDVECFNFHKKGHYKADCWAEGGGKEGEGPKSKGKGKAKEVVATAAAAAAAAAKAKAAEEKVEAWMVSVEDDSEESFDEGDLACGFNSSDDLFYDSDSMPDLECQSVSNDSEMEERNLSDHRSKRDELRMDEG